MNIPFENELKLPVVAAPMFLISGPQLVIECCKNGIIGTFPDLNQRTSEGFEQWIIQIKNAFSDFDNETGTKAAPFGVNLIVHHSNPRLKADLALCVKHQVPLIINDSIELCIEVDADGVHLGKQDSSFEKARDQLSADKIIGITCNNSIKKAREALKNKADYIAIGAFNLSRTKKVKYFKTNRHFFFKKSYFIN